MNSKLIIVCIALVAFVVLTEAGRGGHRQSKTCKGEELNMSAMSEARKKCHKKGEEGESNEDKMKRMREGFVCSLEAMGITKDGKYDPSGAEEVVKKVYPAKVQEDILNGLAKCLENELDVKCVWENHMKVCKEE